MAMSEPLASRRDGPDSEEGLPAADVPNDLSSGARKGDGPTPNADGPGSGADCAARMSTRTGCR